MIRLAALLLTFAIPAGALAQHGEPRAFSVERLRPAMDGDGVIDAEWAAVPKHLDWAVAFWLGYANDPLVLTSEINGQTERVASLVEHRVSASLVGSMGLYGWVQLGVELPLALYQGRGDLSDFNDNPASLTAAGIGDLRLSPKVQVLRASEHFVDVAVLLSLTLPTASSRAYLGERTLQFLPEAAVSKEIGDIRLAANLGYRARRRSQTANLVVDDELTYRFGAAYDLESRLGKPLEVAMTLSGSTGAKVPFERMNRNPAELLLAGKYKVLPTLTAFLGTGFGVVAGYAAPDFRIFAGVSFAVLEEKPQVPAPIGDSDGDGLTDDVDKCPMEAEDKDQFSDEDGCPDLDNDGDGVLDADDGAPNDPEDKDSFEDADGVPDLDNDQDGIADINDKCPLEAETRNGYEDEDGCPEQIPDTDNDGLADTVDKCVDVPEDRDGFEDMDGCPDPDNDADGLIDTMDTCPNASGPTENAGCPDSDRDGDGVVDRNDNCPDVPGPAENSGCQAKQLVKISNERIEIMDKVYFDTGKDTIQEVSFQLLDNVAQVLNAHLEIAGIRIEGHSDSQGAAEFNKHLSQLRAEAVRVYLIGKGVDGKRLVAEGIGEERPIESNRSSRGRAANRRVEFHIVRADADAKPAQE
ncbi:MAG: hypothetical protein A2289_25285 [Deltaproteobacteria bacterium RIFOXYA12_FULL_58_15]|nr:MAG: hypothetical protein A2289_25285 [Deltaproteobacteria bacterium RIFOXYA12_FULL_58_15]